MESIIKVIKETMMYALFAFFLMSVFLIFVNILMAVSY